MANNPYINKVEYGGNTLIDLTSDTVDAAHLASGYTAHAASGAPIVGAMNVGEDWIVDDGTSGDWYWRKWDSGVAEAWCTQSKTITGWSGWGSMYEASPAFQETYPSGLFNSMPKLFVNAYAPNIGGIAGIEMYQGGSKTQTPSMYLLRATSGNTNKSASVDMYAIGTWK